MRGFLSLLIAALLLLVFAPAPADASSRWRRAETPHFVFYGEVSERGMREAATTLEQFDAALRSLWSLPNEPASVKLEIYLFSSDSRLREIAPSLDRWVAGFYTAQPEIIAAFATYDDNGFAGREILFHEYAHHFMRENLPGAYPAWFVEGFAEYLQTIKFERGNVILGDFSEGRVADLLAPGQWPTPEQFLRHPDDMNSGLQRRFYAQSWAAVHYLYRDQARMRRFVNYVEALQNGADVVEAFEPAFNMTPEAFQRELQRYVRANIQRQGGPFAPVNLDNLVITRMPEAANDLLLPVVRLKLGNSEGVTSDSAFPAEAEAAAAAFPNEPFAQRVRVRALIARAAYAEARTAIEPMLAATPDDGELNYLMGTTYLDEAVAREDARSLTGSARRYFARAFRANENDVPTLLSYVATYQFGDPMPDSAVDVAVRVANLAPQVTALSLPTAHMLMERERWDEAAVVLRRVAYDPHGGQSDVAQRMLQATLRRDMAGIYESDAEAPPASLCANSPDPCN